MNFKVEHQFENNVVISLGIIVGIIMSMRNKEVSERIKRTGVRAIDSIPFLILTLEPSMKTAMIKNYAKISKNDMKTPGIEAAIKICSEIGDVETLNLLESGGKIDDIADTVCYEYAFYNWLYSIK